MTANRPATAMAKASWLSLIVVLLTHIQASFAVNASATPVHVDAAVLVNATARLQALKVSLLGLAAIALLAIIPAGRMPARMRMGDDDLTGVEELEDQAGDRCPRNL